MKTLETKSVVLLHHHLKHLRLPTIGAECEKVARESEQGIGRQPGRTAHPRDGVKDLEDDRVSIDQVDGAIDRARRHDGTGPGTVVAAPRVAGPAVSCFTLMQGSPRLARPIHGPRRRIRPGPMHL